MAAAAALAVTDELVLPLRAVGDLAAAAGVSREEVVVITQCATLGGKLPFDDPSVGAVLSFIQKVESFGDQLVAEINRVLKAGGIVLVQSLTPSSDQKPNNYIERQLLMGGLVEVQASATSSFWEQVYIFARWKCCQVYENIIAEAGHGKPVVTYTFEALGKVRVAFLIFTAAAMVWDIYTSQDRLQSAVRDSVGALTAASGLVIGVVVDVGMKAGLVALDIEIASAALTVIGAIAGFGVGVLIGMATGALLDLIFSSGTSKVEITDGLTVCRVAPMPDGNKLARLVKHNYPNL